MNIQEYQDWTSEVWGDWDKEQSIVHCLYGLQTETAEITDVHKKKQFTPNRAVATWDRDHLVEEIGDVLYYLTRYADVQGISMLEVIDMNVDKLEKRYGKLQEQARKD